MNNPGELIHFGVRQLGREEPLNGGGLDRPRGTAGWPPRRKNENIVAPIPLVVVAFRRTLALQAVQAAEVEKVEGASSGKAIQRRRGMRRRCHQRGT